MVYLYNLTHVHGNHITPDFGLVKIKADRNKTSFFTLRNGELIHDILYGWGWGIVFNPSLSVTLDDTALILLSLSTITLQLLSLNVVNV